MLTINFTPFPNLETERLLLRRVNKDDVNEIFALRSNPETMKYIPRPLVKTNDDALEHIALIDAKIESNEGINWAITLKDNPKLIGIIGHYRIKPEHFRAEIGYMILPEYNGKGIVSEAVKEVVTYGFNEMKLHSIEAIIDPENFGSEKVLQKCGFVKEAHFKENEFYEGRFLDAVIYSILNK
ncbi:ribosomal-protein-alanine N-acetyltransferase [Flavobacterium sp. CG_23.5]|uniref:GNAT family N-acetyltransferase n=1 Tax=unclassified Flavobacterium TaxID=196869 RepID=UPI0018CA3DAB|nr:MULTISPECIES: GNAT family N-acetyltransferase [unclassified Flavobacterium]MBG6110094.1 ribosomal-protein-alanine N-acetyltransferase [Flavobacterium sp. CG_9.10]MBP2281909.1 ribosomal-protein-alanine N-acetyltransferase [Flavobacterium sp. CG_23.5]